MPPRFSFLPPRFLTCPPRYFFGRKKLVFLGGIKRKNLRFRPEKTFGFRQRFFFLFFIFADHLLLVVKFVISAKKSLRISAKTFFFGDHLLLVGKFVILGRKSLRISAKIFAPLILILPPRFREAWRCLCREWRINMDQSIQFTNPRKQQNAGGS